MTTQTDRLGGPTGDQAIKAPCVVATSANITLSGLQTINGVTVAQGDRVLVTAQTSSVNNGIYNASTSAWTRATDYDGNRDVVSGTRVLVGQVLVYSTVASNPIIIGTTPITFVLSGVGAGVNVVSIKDFGAKGDGVTDDSTAIQTAQTSLAATGGGIYFPPGTYVQSATVTLKSNVKMWGEHGASIKWTGGSGSVQFTSATSGCLIEAGISGIDLNCGNATKCLELNSPWRCTFGDITIASNSSTNLLIDILTNSTGTVNPDTNYNGVFNHFENILQTGTCGTLLRLKGNGVVSPGQFVTLNTFDNLNTIACVVMGIQFSQWCDNNVFPGMTRICVTGAGGIGVRFNDSAISDVGVYSNTFDHLAVDTFGTGLGRTAVLMNDTKGNAFSYFYNDPQAESGDIVTTANTASFEATRVIPSNNFLQRQLLGGFMCIGGQTTTKYSIFTTSFWLRGTDQASVVLADTFSSDAAGTSSAGVTVTNALQAAAWTLTTYFGVNVSNLTLGAGSAVTNQVGINVNDLTSGTNNFGVKIGMTAGNSKWGVYSGGSAANYFDGGLVPRIGTTTATDGFVSVSASSGPPTGTPSRIIAGVAPLYLDFANNKLYVFSSTDGSTTGQKWRSTIALTT